MNRLDGHREYFPGGNWKQERHIIKSVLIEIPKTKGGQSLCRGYDKPALQPRRVGTA